MPRPVRLFHPLVVSFQKSLIRVCPAFAKEVPFLRPAEILRQPIFGNPSILNSKGILLGGRGKGLICSGRASH